MYPNAYIEYLVYFHGPRDFFECHEVLEEHWKKDKKEERNPHWVGLIQVAVSLYHQRRNNFSGAIRMMASAINILSKEAENLKLLGLQYEELLQRLEQRLTDMYEYKDYEEFNLPIADLDLLAYCKQKSLEIGSLWGSDSDFENGMIIHKHTLRDRSEVIEERLKQQYVKEKERKA
ncbi:DUF309 domain-containing protein [Bacillus sp. FJAT-44742]|uniref:DUF309 domain-containing protein n=1 Tax=Bacillus sp. FJAT-44742 TaxID=2014005 RepID=UPI000C248C58|nr:DUF309 domain-containing protein [Bacillus sp. FJAT-44742]